MPHSRPESNHSWLLGNAIDIVLNEVNGATWSTLKKRLREVENDFVKAAESNSTVAHETKRRVAEAVLVAATAKKCSFAELKAAYRRLRKLGFTTPDRRTTFTVLFARECNAIGHGQYALRVMKELLELLHDYPIQQRKRARKVVDQVIQDIRTDNQLT